MSTKTSCQISHPTSERVTLGLLIGLHIILCCISLVYSSYHYSIYHIYYDPVQLKASIAAVAAFAPLSYLFLQTRFTFGYFVGFYFYTMVLGYLWLNCFSDFTYNHWLSGASAAASMAVFLIPALFLSSSIRQRFRIPESMFDRFLTILLLVGVATVVVGASYSFKLVSLVHMYDFRAKISMPNPLYYWMGITSNALLPFAFACFVVCGNYWRAALTVALLLLFYPIMLNKVALFTPAWLVAMAVLTRFFNCRITVIISLFLPILVGMILYATFNFGAIFGYFNVINLRMIATPANAMDIYNDFFFHHPYTYFCQIRLLKDVVSCPYQEQLGVVMEEAYGVGNFNASLFSTEGIASVGPLFAPLSAFACGLVIGFANRLSAGLPPRFVLISGSVLPQILLNVPLTTTLLTHGAAFLFLLWYFTPRSMFPQEPSLLELTQEKDRPFVQIKRPLPLGASS